MFPSEAMLAMRVAEADSIEDFTKTSARKRKEVSPNENITLQNNRLRLLKTGTGSFSSYRFFLFS